MNGNHINFNNPVDENEDLGKYLREDPEKLKAFRDFIGFVRQQVVLLKSCQFLDEYTNAMNTLFGKDLVKKQLDLIASDYGKKQANNNLSMNSAGIISTSGTIASPRTYFHGDK